MANNKAIKILRSKKAKSHSSISNIKLEPGQLFVDGNNELVVGNAINGSEISSTDSIIKSGANSVNEAAIVDNSVTTSKIKDLNVTNSKLASNAVSTVKIQDNAITTAKINNSNVTTAKLANKSVTTDKLASDAVIYKSTKTNAVQVTHKNNISSPFSMDLHIWITGCRF